MSGKYIFDIEGDGLYYKIENIWMISLLNLDTGMVESFSPMNYHGIRAALEIMANAEVLIGHNIIDFDIPALKKIYNWEPNPSTKITDTLVLSRLFFPDREGGHSLRAWGERLGFPKGDHDDWTCLSEEMIKYCEQDVRVNLAVYNALKEEIKGQNWGESIQIEHKVQEIISEQGRNGFQFDMDLATKTVNYLQSEISMVDQALLGSLPTEVKVGKKYPKPFLKQGGLTKRAINAIGVGKTIFGPFEEIVFKTTDLSSDKQTKDWLLSIGWKPTEWNTSVKTGNRTSPKLTEDSFDSLPDKKIGGAIKHRVQSRHRLGQISGWIEKVRPDGRISAEANTIGTPTARMRHKHVVNIPSASTYPDKPFEVDGEKITHPKAGHLFWNHEVDPYGFKPSVYMGTEMRAMFCSNHGYKIVGHDASGIELRMLAHYMNDPEYTEVLLNGDIHSHNRELAGLHTRASAKTFIYAFIYGAGDAKLGSIVSGGAAEGAELRAKFLRENPNLGALISKVKRKAKRDGFLTGLDGRRIYLRVDNRGRVMEHKALNTLLQCGGAVVMKKSMILLDQWAKEAKLDFRKVADMHDEGQAEVLEEHAQKYAELAEKSIVEAGIQLNLTIPLAAEAKIGNNWAETH